MSRFIATTHFTHDTVLKTGILVTNLGTPDAPTASALRPYLRDFLWDRRVVEIPRLVWWVILNFFVLPFRPKKSAALYKKIWTKQGSPLLVHSIQQVEKLRQQFPQAQIELAMRYGTPSIESALKKLKEAQIDHLLVLPLYPQYASSTVGSTFEAVTDSVRKWRWIPDIRFISQYHSHPAYIHALSEQIQQHWKTQGKMALLVFSFHGIPKFHLTEGDPYFCHCHSTARHLVKALGLNDDEWILTFQSRFGKAEWLQPYTDQTLKQLPAKGITSVDVVCPGFPSDCLETLEEIEEENKAYFMEAGGKDYHYIPALNASDRHITALSQIIQDNTQGWSNMESTPSSDAKQQANIRLEAAQSWGADT